MTKIRILVADDHTLFREGMAALFSATKDVTLIGEAANAQEAITKTRDLNPDVVLMDINMPGMDGVAATRRILKDNPDISVVMLTMLEDDSSVFAAMRAGARGYVLKGAQHKELLETIKAAAAGQVLFGPNIATRMKGFFENLASIQSAQSPEEAFPEITNRELEVLDLIAQGHSNLQISETLVISAKTVRNHITSIFSKMQVADRAKAIIKAREVGLGKPDNND